MKFQSILRGAVIGCWLLGSGFAAQAQDVAPSHLEAAREAIALLQVTNAYDSVLPQAALALKGELIQQNPDRQEEISRIVEEKSIELAGRRSDLEKEAALAFAKSFSEDELKAIAAFYGSTAGKKLLENGPIATREVANAARIWQTGVARDLAQAVGQQLAKDAPAPAGAEAPAESEAEPEAGN